MHCNKIVLFDDIVGAEEKRCWELDPDRLRGFEINRGFEICDLLYREIGGFRSAQEPWQRDGRPGGRAVRYEDISTPAST